MNMVSPWTNRHTMGRNVPLMRLQNDADLREIYKFGRKLGQGSFGVVYEATHIETQTKWAIKEVCRPVAGSSKVKMLGHEINILKQVNHAHIIHLHEVYETAKMIYLVTELCVGGELKQLLQQKKFFTEDETRHIIYSLADAVVYLHKRDIVHRDLKLENILLKNSLEEDDNGRINIKVTDFGLSVQTGGVGIENIMTEACGTLTYMAPEMMSGRGYSQWCDVWSIGVVMYMLLCGEPPFVSTTRTNLLEEIMNNGVKFTQSTWATVSDAAKILLTCLLKVDPAYRMSANQLLENPWIKGDNTVSVPSNVLEMMHNHHEQEERTKTLEDVSLTSSDDTLDPLLVPGAASTETDSNCRIHAKLSHERDSSFCPPATSTKRTKESGGTLLQDKRKSSSETLGPPQPTTTQSHAGVKPCTQPSAKQRRPRDKKDVGTGQKPASDISKAVDQRPSTSSKSRTGPSKPPASSKTNAPSE
ncbi:serine/threonine-protein kinase 33 isoform X1 [Dicentrarchus labrax]|uniref:non-specific serine/threonine protein kinase n=2 Tax=Dicentrarchus labrax TaxID=13489 RepID=A0A8P4GP34_DICLA|nr:serine/threonine-protein kinase 33 isoform X1 [Dicentrarchus labrax]XP_051236139.1 serine/threonine-protein kinase 33 isoform X1 [Dicentrarchus labrax]